MIKIESKYKPSGILSLKTLTINVSGTGMTLVSETFSALKNVTGVAWNVMPETAGDLSTISNCESGLAPNSRASK